MSPGREEALLEMAHRLVEKLVKVPVHLADDLQGPAVGQGVPQSCLGNLTSFLHRERNLERLRSFVDRLDRLDHMVGQNEKNPRAQHAALRSILHPWLGQHSELSAEEVLYLLSWARRLLPAKPQDGKARPSGKKEERTPAPNGPSGFGQLARALEKARNGS